MNAVWTHAFLTAVGNTLYSMAGTLAAFLIWGWLTNRKRDTK